MVLFVVYEARIGDTSLANECLMVPVGSSRKNGRLTDLAKHQNLHHMQ